MATLLEFCERAIDYKEYSDAFRKAVSQATEQQVTEACTTAYKRLNWDLYCFLHVNSKERVETKETTNEKLCRFIMKTDAVRLFLNNPDVDPSYNSNYLLAATVKEINNSSNDNKSRFARLELFMNHPKFKPERGMTSVVCALIQEADESFVLTFMNRENVMINCDLPKLAIAAVEKGYIKVSIQIFEWLPTQLVAFKKALPTFFSKPISSENTLHLVSMFFTHSNLPVTYAKNYALLAAIKMNAPDLVRWLLPRIEGNEIPYFSKVEIGKSMTLWRNDMVLALCSDPRIDLPALPIEIGKIDLRDMSHHYGLKFSLTVLTNMVNMRATINSLLKSCKHWTVEAQNTLLNYQMSLEKGIEIKVKQIAEDMFLNRVSTNGEDKNYYKTLKGEIPSLQVTSLIMSAMEPYYTAQNAVERLKVKDKKEDEVLESARIIGLEAIQPLPEDVEDECSEYSSKLMFSRSASIHSDAQSVASPNSSTADNEETPEDSDSEQEEIEPIGEPPKLKMLL